MRPSARAVSSPWVISRSAAASADWPATWAIGGTTAAGEPAGAKAGWKAGAPPPPGSADLVSGVAAPSGQAAGRVPGTGPR